MENQSNKKIVIGVVALALLVLLVAWWLSRVSPADNNLAALGNLDGTASSTELASIKVGDQFPGSIIFVSDVRLPNGGWVIIKKDSSGRPGNIVGAGYFDKTVNVGEVAVPNTTEGEKYFALLYDDNGDERFTLSGDKPILNVQGEPIMTSFTITRILPEVKG
jgi:hypothetical protein